MLDDATLLGFITAAAVDARNTIFEVHECDCKFGYDPGLTDESLHVVDIIDDFLTSATGEHYNFGGEAL